MKVNFIISTSSTEYVCEMEKQHCELFYYSCFKDVSPVVTIQEFINIWLPWKRKENDCYRFLDEYKLWDITFSQKCCESCFR